MKPYLETLAKIINEGHDRPDRTGVGRRCIFGVETRYDVSNNVLPLVTTRKIFTKGLIYETLWFISGAMKTKELQDNGVNIWNKWAVKEEDIDSLCTKYLNLDDPLAIKAIKATLARDLTSIGPLYGTMWRNAPRQYFNELWPIPEYSDIPSDKKAIYKNDYESLPEKPVNEEKEIISLEEFSIGRYMGTVDQLNELVQNLKKNPYSARHVVNAWIPEFVPYEELTPQHNVLLGKAALAACHPMFQCFVSPPKEEGGKLRLSLKLTMRSSDFPVGTPYNTAQYALLLAMIAHVCDMETHEFIFSGGDVHVYADQIELAKKQILREPMPLPKLWLNPEVKDLFAFTPNDIKILDYKVNPEDLIDPIRYPVAT